MGSPTPLLNLLLRSGSGNEMTIPDGDDSFQWNVDGWLSSETDYTYDFAGNLTDTEAYNRGSGWIPQVPASQSHKNAA